MNDAAADPGNLANLHDIVMPASVPWWPLAPGWYVLAIIVILVLAVLAIRFALRYRANRYRHAALAELDAIYQTVQSPDTRAAALQRMAVLVKRVALVSFGRPQVARLSDEPWRRFLADAGRTGALSPEISGLVDRALYGRIDDAALSDETMRVVYEAARSWIDTHRPSPSTKGASC